MIAVTFYRHSSLGAKLGVNPAQKALDGLYWQRVALGVVRGPEWATTMQARRMARDCWRLAKWLQRKDPLIAGGTR